MIGQVVPPDGALLVELLDLLVDQLVRVLPLVLSPASLDEHAVGGVLLLAAILRHLSSRLGSSPGKTNIGSISRHDAAAQRH